MLLSNEANVASQQISHRLDNFRESSFFLSDTRNQEITTGIEALVGFLKDRPAMMISDSVNKDGILRFLDKEWYEAEHSDTVNDLDNLSCEIGDTVFFAVLAGVMHWEEMSENERDFVSRAMEWTREKGSERKIDVNEMLVEVATEKDPTNYRKEFYQLKPHEETNQVYPRVVAIGKLHRKVRELLNGDWKESSNLLGTLATFWSEHKIGERKTQAMQVEELFTLSGLNVVDNLAEIV